MDIKKLKKDLGISQKDIAEFFQMSYGAYANSTAKERYETAICKFYELVKDKLKNKSN
jgi:transcriptional regulator with XRE-family HTH domain|tara:strand:+ start:279 stop:452 length:174 start_codon:yes stop_codon:yes gene_type:complete